MAGKADGYMMISIAVGATLAAVVKKLADERGISISQLLRDALVGTFGDELPPEAHAEINRSRNYLASHGRIRKPSDTAAAS